MNLKNIYWYFNGALSPKFCDELIEHGNAQKELLAITGKLKMQDGTFNLMLLSLFNLLNTD